MLRNEFRSESLQRSNIFNNILLLSLLVTNMPAQNQVPLAIQKDSAEGSENASGIDSEY